jgi:hypothetical protein
LVEEHIVITAAVHAVLWLVLVEERLLLAADELRSLGEIDHHLGFQFAPVGRSQHLRGSLVVMRH